MIVPQRGFAAPAQESLRRPARIGGDERAIAFDRSAIVVAAQDDPLGEFLRHRIRYRRLGLGRIGGLVLADEVDDVFQRIGIGLRGRCRRGNRRRRSRLARGRRQRRMLPRRRRDGGRHGRDRRGIFGSMIIGRGRGFGHDVARDRPCLRQWNLWFGCGIRRQCRPSDGQRQAHCQGCQSQGGCAGREGHGGPSRRIIQSLKP